MSKADYALITSIASIFISIGALVWNVWQKFIFVKPALQVTFRLSRVLQPNREQGIAAPTGLRLLSLTVTNMGPGSAVLYTCVIKSKAHWWSRAQYGLINPIHGDPTAETPISLGPFSGGLPEKVEGGAFKGFSFPYEKDSFLTEPIVRIGINDTYQRNIWCRRKDVRAVMRAYKRDFLEG
jgi:hypothetical protein